MHPTYSLTGNNVPGRTPDITRQDTGHRFFTELANNGEAVFIFSMKARALFAVRNKKRVI